MSTNLVEFIIRYAVAGLIGRIVWLIITFGYVMVVTRMDLTLLNKCKNEALEREDKASEKKTTIVKLLVEIIWWFMIWPITLLYDAIELERILRKAMMAKN